MGAGAAVMAAAETPEAVSGLVLVGPFVRGGPTGFTAVMFKLALLKPWGPAVWRSYYKKFYPGRPPADLDAHLDAHHGEHGPAGALEGVPAHGVGRARRGRARVGEVRKPTLVVMGEKDPDWKDPAAEARWVADTLRGETLLVPGAGHYPMTEYPETVNPAIVAFVDRVSARA